MTELNDNLSMEHQLKMLTEFNVDSIKQLPIVGNKMAQPQREMTSDNSFNILKIDNNPMYSTQKSEPQVSEMVTQNFGDSDEYLSTLLQRLRTRTIIIGVGGAGNNAISRLQEEGVQNAITVAVNTDAHDLFYTNSDCKLLIGKEITAGLGAGNNPEMGEKAAEQDISRIRDLVKKDIVFITCGLGGGTGTGAAPVIAREAKKAGALVIVFCTLPFKMEGETKRIIASKGLLRLAKYSDTIIPLPNEKLINLVPNLTLIKGFKVMDEILIRSVKGLVDLVSNCGLVNLDLADVKSVLSKSDQYYGFIGHCEIGMNKLVDQSGEPYSKEQVSKILRERTIKALKNPLLDQDPTQIKSILVSIIGNHSLTLTQVNEIVTAVSEQVSTDAKLKFGTIIDPNINVIKIHFIGQGAKSQYITMAEHL
jgi:cell division protein FtsZ